MKKLIFQKQEIRKNTFVTEKDFAKKQKLLVLCLFLYYAVIVLRLCYKFKQDIEILNYFS